MPELKDVLDAVLRVERKLDVLIAAMGEDEDCKPGLTLDGEPAGGERDQSQSLG